MRRREFIALIGGTAAWPLAARAQQQTAMPVVAFIYGGWANAVASYTSEFGKGLTAET